MTPEVCGFKASIRTPYFIIVLGNMSLRVVLGAMLLALASAIIDCQRRVDNYWSDWPAHADRRNSC